METHRHKNYIDRRGWKRNGFSRTKLVLNMTPGVLSACLVQHFHRGVDAHDIRVEMKRERFREAARATTQVENFLDA
jgi:hypothetical protein